MKHEPNSEDSLRLYLLGRLSEEAAERIEKRLMTDAAFTEVYTEAEQDLADEYVAGALDASEIESFESVFLAHRERRRLLDFAQALRRYVDAETDEASAAGKAPPARHGPFAFLRAQSLWFRWAWAAALLTIAVVAGALIYQVRSLQQSLAGIRSQLAVSSAERQKMAEDLQRERDRSTQLEEELSAAKAGGGAAQAAGQQPGAGVIAITLYPGMVRDAGGAQTIQRIVFQPGTEVAELSLVLDEPAYPSYDALLQTADGKTVWKGTGLHSRRISGESVIVVRLSRDILQPQDYLLKLGGVKPDGTSESAGTFYLQVAPR